MKKHEIVTLLVTLETPNFQWVSIKWIAQEVIRWWINYSGMNWTCICVRPIIGLTVVLRNSRWGRVRVTTQVRHYRQNWDLTLKVHKNTRSKSQNLLIIWWSIQSYFDWYEIQVCTMNIGGKIVVFSSWHVNIDLINILLNFKSQ